MTEDNKKTLCGKTKCDKENCKCKSKKKEIGFDAWLKILEEEVQPVCNTKDPENCENCGS